MTRHAKINILYFFAAAFAVLLVHELAMFGVQTRTIPWSEFEQLVSQNKVESVQVSDRFVQGALKEKLPSGETRFQTTRVDPDIAALLQPHGVKVTGVIESTFLRDLLGWTLPILLFMAVWWFVIRRMAERGGMGGGLMSIGKSRAKVYMEANTGVTFEDVAGVDEAKDELREVVDFLRDPQRHSRLGGRMPKGVLLVGPPGSGKTLLAKAVAGEAHVPFFSISGSEFVEMFVGVGAARVRDLFEQARQKAPAIIFIDELDALGRARNAGFAGGHDEKEQTLNQLLVELDGFDTTTGVVLLAATNRPEILDPALLRAGRFDRQVLVDRPDKPGRIQILQVHLRRVRLAPEVDAEKIAALTPGFTGADLANLVNEAALRATRRGGEAITMADFDHAVERLVAGLEKRNRLLNPREREIVAYHEMGHALVALALPGTDVVHKVSIIPRGIGALGYTIQRPTEDRFLMTQEELENRMAVLMGGRAAEFLVFGHLSTGAADDLRRVTDIARAMVVRYGMSERLGNVAYEKDRQGFLGPGVAMPAEREYGPDTASVIDHEVKAITDAAFARSVELLRARREVLDRTARRLLERETLDEAELKALAQPRPAAA